MRRHRRVLGLVGVMCVALAVVAASAGAAYTEVGTFADDGSGTGGTGSGAGQLSNPGQAAVRVATGKLYVADTANNRVQVFSPTETGGAYESNVEITEPTGIAIDQSSGELYVAAASGIAKYDSGLNPIVLGWTDPGVTGTLAVDPSTGDLLVADQGANLVRRFEADGTAAGSFAAERPISIAANSAGELFVVTSTGDITLECGASSTVRRFSGAGLEAGIVGTSLEAPGAVAVDLADDSIVVASRVNQYNCGSQNPQVVFFDSAGTEAQSLSLTGNTLYAMVSGLAAATFADESSRAYAITKSPANDGFGNTKAVVLEVPPPPSLPVASAAPAVPSYTEAVLRAKVNPGHDTTTYRFEYGPTASYGLSTAGRTIAAGGKDVVVEDSVGGLQPGTTYHFRVVATNSAGGAQGLDGSFVTAVRPGGADSCANAAIRSAQSSSSLPDCRAYEMVSPVDKGFTDVIFGNGGASNTYSQSAPDGNAISFSSFGAFGDAPGAPVNVTYLAQRSGDGWRTKSLTTAQGPRFVNLNRFNNISEDLSKSALASYGSTAPGAPEGRINYYVRDNSTLGDQLVGPADPQNTGGGPVEYATGTDDYSHVALYALAGESWAPGDNVEAGESNVYEVSGGQVRLASIMPDGSTATGAPQLSEITSGEGTTRFGPRSISRDGSRIIFVTPTRGNLQEKSVYLREDGTSTIEVSASQRTLPDPEAGTQEAKLWTASADASKIFFTSSEKLTNDSTARNGGVEDLYRYDVDTGVLTDLTSGDPQGGFVHRVLGVSDDGATVYFLAFGNLAPGGEDGGVYMWKEEGGVETTTYVGGDSSASEYRVDTGSNSPDGRFLSLHTNARLTGYDNAGHFEFYLFDAETEALTCASCNPNEASATSDALLQPVAIGPFVGRNSRPARSLSDDGRRLAFSTAEALVRGDTNGVDDVYLYEDGRAHLLSGGTDRFGSFLADMTPSGDDVFVTTRQRLVASDVDNSVDLYDLRVGGGIAGQNVALSNAPPCQGEACRSPLSPPPAAALPATAGLVGPASAKPRHQAKKKKQKKQQQSRKRHKRKHRGDLKRPADATKKGGRR